MPKVPQVNFAISDNPYFARQRAQIRLNLRGDDGALLYPTLKKFEDTGRKTEYEMGKFLGSLTKKSKINIEELREIVNCEKIQEDAIRGECLMRKPECCLKKLKEIGIKRVIDIRYPDSEYANICQNIGLEYNGFRVADIYSYSKDELIRLINTIRKGDYYIGCTFGTNDTDITLLLNQFFNPKNKLFSNVSIYGYHKEHIGRIKNIAKRLNQSDKKALGWTPEFEKKFNERIAKELAELNKRR